MCSSIRSRLSSLGLVAALLALLVGCVPAMPVPPTPKADPSDAWARKLASVVSPDGEVDYAALRAEPGPLRAYVGWWAEHGPESDKWRVTSDNLRLSLYLNVVNAWMLLSVVEGDPLTGPMGPGPATGRARDGLPTLLRGPPLPFASTRIRLDRNTIQLDRLLTLRMLGSLREPLAIAGLGCAARSCPPVPAELFRRDDVEAALARQMVRWIASGRLVRDDGATLHFSAALRPWMPLFARWRRGDAPCAATAPYAEGPLKARLEACESWAWDAWDGRLDGRL